MKIAVGLNNLETLDMGRLNEAFQHHLRTVVRDCMDRPGETKKRGIKINFSIVPERNETGTCERVLMYVQIGNTVPAHQTEVFQCQPQVNGNLLVNPVSPENVDQHTLDELTSEEG